MKKSIKVFVLVTYPVLLMLLMVMIFYLLGIKAENKRHVNKLCTVTNALYIIRAIEEYHSQTGDLPESLNKLAQHYIPQVYSCPWGNTGWIYKNQNRNFTLAAGFKNSDSNDYLYPEILYSSENKAWIFNN